MLLMSQHLGSEKGTRLFDSPWARDGSVFTVPFVMENKQAKGNSHDKKE